jgi:hypothetical protein
LDQNGPQWYGYQSNSDNTSQSIYSVILVPVFDTLKLATDNPHQVVGFLQVLLNWEVYFHNLLPDGYSGSAILTNDCGQTYRLSFNNATVEMTPYTDTDSYSQATATVEDVLGLQSNGQYSCAYSLYLVDVKADENVDYVDDLLWAHLYWWPLFSTLMVLVLVTFAFVQYNKEVRARNEELIKSAAKSSAIVDNMFPSKIVERLYAENEPDPETGSRSSGRRSKKRSKKNKRKKKDKHEKKGTIVVTEGGESTNHESAGILDLECFTEPRYNRAGSERLKSYLDHGLTAEDAKDSSPIADLFPNCTVLFADISGRLLHHDFTSGYGALVLKLTALCFFGRIHGLEFSTRTFSGFYSVGDFIQGL